MRPCNGTFRQHITSRALITDHTAPLIYINRSHTARLTPMPAGILALMTIARQEIRSWLLCDAIQEKKGRGIYFTNHAERMFNAEDKCTCVFAIRWRAQLEVGLFSFFFFFFLTKGHPIRQFKHVHITVEHKVQSRGCMYLHTRNMTLYLGVKIHSSDWSVWRNCWSSLPDYWRARVLLVGDMGALPNRLANC